MNWRYFSAIVVSLGVVAGASAGIANAHAPSVTQGSVITWTHPNHANDEVGAAACVQAAPIYPAVLSITKCVTTTNRIYKYRSPYPQVPRGVNPAKWDSSGNFLQDDPTVPGVTWLWTRAGPSIPGTPSGIAIYGIKPELRPLVYYRPAWAVVAPADATVNHPLDGDGPGRIDQPRPTVYTEPPADFIRSAFVPPAAAGAPSETPLANPSTPAAVPLSVVRAKQRAFKTHTLPSGLRRWCNNIIRKGKPVPLACRPGHKPRR